MLGGIVFFFLWVIWMVYWSIFFKGEIEGMKYIKKKEKLYLEMLEEN